MAAATDTTQLNVTGDQSALFPEDDDSQDAGGLAGQLSSLPPEDLSNLAQGLDPDVRLNLANALVAAMPDEDKMKIDTIPSADVEQNMKGAVAERPEMQYQMSVARRCKQLSKAGIHGVQVENELKSWRERAESLQEDGYATDKQLADWNKQFDKSNELRFSIILDNRGALHDACLQIETLEAARAGTATLSKNVLNRHRMSGAKPVPLPKEAKGETFDRKEAEEAGSRLGKMQV